MLANLLQNAIKYSPGRETVIVEDLFLVFGAFFRGGTSEATSGTGLGLSVAKAAAERLGGGLTIESELGKGTTFQVELPGLMRNRNLRRRKDET